MSCEKSLDCIVVEIADQQGWNDNSILQLLKAFIESRSSYWPEENPMIDDLKSFLQNVANEENDWVLETVEDTYDETGF
jgi:hypothetical protein